MIFVDTSALIALRDRASAQHARAVETFERLLLDGTELVTHNYVEVETLAVSGRRFEPGAVREIVSDLLGPVEVRWIDPATHASARSALLAAPGKRVSFVDLVSFEFMRRERISSAFAYDRDFARQGFESVG